MRDLHIKIRAALCTNSTTVPFLINELLHEAGAFEEMANSSRQSKIDWMLKATSNGSALLDYICLNIMGSLRYEIYIGRDIKAYVECSWILPFDSKPTVVKSHRGTYPDDAILCADILLSIASYTKE